MLCSVAIICLLNKPRIKAFYLSASSIGSKLRSAVSLGSLNQDLMGIALSGGKKTASQSCQKNGHGSDFMMLFWKSSRSLRHKLLKHLRYRPWSENNIFSYVLVTKFKCIKAKTWLSLYVTLDRKQADKYSPQQSEKVWRSHVKILPCVYTYSGGCSY